MCGVTEELLPRSIHTAHAQHGRAHQLVTLRVTSSHQAVHSSKRAPAHHRFRCCILCISCATGVSKRLPFSRFEHTRNSLSGSVSLPLLHSLHFSCIWRVDSFFLFEILSKHASARLAVYRLSCCICLNSCAAWESKHHPIRQIQHTRMSTRTSARLAVSS